MMRALRATTVAIALAGAMAIPPATAQTSPQAPDPAAAEPAWLAASRQVAALLRDGQAAAARAALAQARTHCPAEGGEAAICASTLLLQSASAEAALGRQDTAEADLRAALAARETALGETHPLTGEAAASLGIFLSQRGRAEAAAPLLERAVESLARPEIGRHDMLVSIYGHLVATYRAQGRNPAAITAAREARETLTRLAGAASPHAVSATLLLTAQLRAADAAEEAIDLLLAALASEALAHAERARLAAEAAQIAAQHGRNDEVAAAVETARARIDPTDAGQAPHAIALLLAAAELALAQGENAAASAHADLAARLAASHLQAGDSRITAARLLQARALLATGQAEAALAGLDALLRPPAPVFEARIWRIRALLDTARLAEAAAALNDAQAALAAEDPPPLPAAALLAQFRAQLAERNADPAAARAALESIAARLPPLASQPANAAQFAALWRDLIRLRAMTGDHADALARLNALLAAQAAARQPAGARVETRLVLARLAAALGETAAARDALAAAATDIAPLERGAPRAAAVLFSRLAEATLALSGGDAAAQALAHAEHARQLLDRAPPSPIDAARLDVLRGTILLRLARAEDAARACLAARDRLAGEPAAETGLWNALICAVRAETAAGHAPAAIALASTLRDLIPAARSRERAEALRLSARARLAGGDAAGAEADARAALDAAEQAEPRPFGLRADIWLDIAAALHQGGDVRGARNAAASARQAAREDRAGPALLARVLDAEGRALIETGQFAEAVATLEQARTVLARHPGEMARAEAQILAALARAEYARGRFAAAQDHAALALARLRPRTDAPAEDLAALLELSAAIRAAEGADTAAETALHEALRLRAQGPRDPGGSAAARALIEHRLALLLARRGLAEAAAARRAAALGLLESPGVPPAWAARLRAAIHAADPAAPPEARAAALAACRAAGKLPAGMPAADDLPDCRLAHAEALRAAGDRAAAEEAAAAILAERRAEGDADRPDLAGPLRLLAHLALERGAVAEALGLSAELEERAEALPRAERPAAWITRGTVLARDGQHAAAETACRKALSLILAPDSPPGFAAAIAPATTCVAAALRRQGKGAAAVAQWEASLARLRDWGDPPAPRAALLFGLGTALAATGAGDSAIRALTDAAALEAADAALRPRALAAAALIAAERGRIAEAHALAARLRDLPAPAPALAAAAEARLAAHIAEETGDHVQALLAFSRLATQPDITAGLLPGGHPGLHAARAALALGRADQARALADAARARFAAPPAPDSEDALLLLEIAAGLAATGPDPAAAHAAAEAWHQAILRHRGGESRDAVRAERALAALDTRAGDTAEAAARLAHALGVAQRLHGPDSPLWTQTAEEAAAAAERIGDTARAASLREAVARNRAGGG